MSIEKAAKALETQNAAYLYLSSYDVHLSEYVPRVDSVRIFLSGFTGSVAETLMSKEGKLVLFVDGRYHEQADNECTKDNITIVKVPYGVSLKDALFGFIEDNDIKNVHYLPERTSEIFKRELEKKVNVFSLDSSEFYKDIGFKEPSIIGELQSVDISLSGESSLDKCARLVSENELYFINGLDTLAWMTNLRSYHIPSQSTYRGVALVSKQEIFLFTDCKLKEGLQLPEHIKKFKLNEWSQVASKIDNISKVFWDKNYTSANNIQNLYSFFSNASISETSRPFAYEWNSLKNESEIKAFEQSFEKSDLAIFNSISWVRDQIKKGIEINEAGFRDMVGEFYKDGGAHGQSFSTISGFGANSSIIHYSNPSESRKYIEGENILLDSGAFYDGGLATDCTRTFIGGGEASSDQKKYYTLVLKSLLALLNTHFPKGTLGKELDAIARKPIIEAGYNYAHGTGHGVGVNVHEYGYSITPQSEIEIREGTVGSLEPGLYIEGVGGVRLENIVTVIEDPDDSELLCFKNFIYIGFCPDLIDETMLTDVEMIWLNAYEDQCFAKGRSFRK
jgi:Xaa-Pro aminopeptidase